MSNDLHPYIEAEKITAKQAEVLSQLTPGAFCKHRSWGVGKIASWELLIGQVMIDFETKKGHPMQLQYAAESLTFIPEEHILARIVTEPDAVKAQACSDPISFMRLILSDHGGKATSAEISAILVPAIFNVAGFKKWFESTKKQLKADGHFYVPLKKGEPITFQGTPQSPNLRFLDHFRTARHPKDQVAALDAARKSSNFFAKELEELQSLVIEVEEAAKRGGRIHTSHVIELLLIRDEICTHHEALNPSANALSLVTFISESPNKLTTIFQEIPATKYASVLQALPLAFPEDWQEKSLRLTTTAEPRLTSEIFKLFVAQGKREIFADYTRRIIRERSASSHFVLWLCKERTKTLPEFINEELFATIISAMECDMHAEIKSKRLEEFLLEDRELMTDLLGKASRDATRQVIRSIMVSSVFSDLNRRSLLARILKVHPEFESFVTNDEEVIVESSETLIVSWASLQRRKEELEHLEKVLIPQNIRDIATARSYGDLRENFEFKSAKEQQAVLNRQKGELELLLHNARGTNFENIDPLIISIGSVVTLEPIGGGDCETYSILGAWDSAPEKGWVSYQALIGKSLLGKKLGEVINLPTDQGSRAMKIVSMRPFIDIDALGAVSA